MTYSDNYPNNRYSYFEQYPKHTSYSHSNHIQQPAPVKVEVNDSPNLHSNHYHHQASLAQFSQKPALPVFRFGDPGSASISSSSPSTPSGSFTFMSSHPWPSIASSSSASTAGSAFQHHQQQYAAERMHGYSMPTSLNGHSQAHAHAMALNDEYDDGEDDALGELPASGMGIGLGGYSSGGFGGAEGGLPGSSKAGEKQVRRRSSKACDQCRKSKCKCERSGTQDPCRNCVMLGTPCTFLGPSRKRGPPKGYIDAIEARLHQTEALIGILLSSKDSRAKSLLEDLSEDSLAREIINRVNNSPYGLKGRNRGADTSGSSSRSRPPPSEPKDSEGSNIQSTHPSNEWQDLVTTRLDSIAAQRNTLIPEDDQVYGEEQERPTSSSGQTANAASPSDDEATASHSRSHDRPLLSLRPPTASSPVPGSASTSLLTPHSATADRSEDIGAADNPPSRRQRRRVDDNLSSDTHAHSPSSASASGRSRSPAQYALLPPHPALLSNRPSTSSLRVGHTSLSPEARDADADEESVGGDTEGDGEDELAVAVGQLSINEDEQVRYHGKASGLHLLGNNEREDGRNEGGIWRFPKARVWPPLPPTARTPTRRKEEEWLTRLPDLAEQEHLLDLYWVYVHPALPILHKKAFMDSYHNVNVRGITPNSPASQVSEPNSPALSQPTPAKYRRIPALLLLAMFSIAARYSSTTSDEVPPPEEDSMWAAGDSYLESARVILDSMYATPRPSTCQALILLGYREVGIGAMAQAWLYIGMAVRMAQDLGMHKCAEKWTSIGRNLFTPEELQERRRIWYGCVVMDKYVSTYIGRPVAIFENDFDTELPSVDEPEESEIWEPHPSPPLLDDPLEHAPSTASPTTGHVISCFNEAAKLSIILSMIVQTLYPIRPHVFRLTEFSRLEKLLDKWYHELPEHLRFDPASPKHTTLPPHALTLHLQYWCTVLLLHRPFIRHLSDASKAASHGSREAETPANSRKNYDLCVQAANHITSIVSVYVESHCVRRASVFLCYYVFTAAIMHVATLTTYPSDPQASMGLHKCMDILHRMQSVWPSAWRAYQLLHGSKVQQLQENRASLSPPAPDRHKRTAEHALDEDASDDARVSSNEHLYRPQTHHHNQGYARVSHSGHTQHTAQQQQQGFPLNLNLPSTDSPAFFPSFDRWTPENSLNNFSGTLSTSVLPQQYSTGLIGERVHRSQERQSQRYPQYWNDYSALGQMEATYGVPLVGDMVSQNTVSSRSSQPNVYAQEQYSVFNNMPSGSQ